MKKHFITGLVILLPIALTLIIVMFIVNVLTKPFQTLVADILSFYGLAGKPFLFLSAAQVSLILSKILILITIFLVLILVGFLAQHFIIRYFLKLGDKIIRKIPVINKIYQATYDVVVTFFSSHKMHFAKVVMVTFPHKGIQSLGLLTKDTPDPHTGMYSVFVPATPNPTMGFLLLFPPEDVHVLQMSIEEALKIIVSCGIICKKIKKTSL